MVVLYVLLILERSYSVGQSSLYPIGLTPIGLTPIGLGLTPFGLPSFGPNWMLLQIGG